MQTSERVQTVRNAWINCVRDEALRMRRPEVSKAVGVGVWIATYADADGSKTFPSTATLAAIAGCSEETVTRCVRLLIAVGLLERKRRPNKTALYQLLVPLQRPDWDTHLYLYTETRQAKRKRKIKEQEAAELVAEREGRNPTQNGFRNPFPPGVPEPVPAGGSEEFGTRSGTGAVPVPRRVPEPVPAGGVHVPFPTSGRDPESDHDMADHSPQPQQRAGARGEDEKSPQLRPITGGGRAPAGGRQPSLLIGPVPDLPPPQRAPTPHDPADYGEVLGAIDAHGEQYAIARYGGRLVTGALATRRTGT